MDNISMNDKNNDNCFNDLLSQNELLSLIQMSNPALEDVPRKIHLYMAKFWVEKEL